MAVVINDIIHRALRQLYKGMSYTVLMEDSCSDASFDSEDAEYMKVG